jgi:cytochrome c-type biogenesis protein CcmH
LRSRAAFPLLGVALTILVLSAAHAAFADGPAPAGQRELRIERSLACPQCTDLPLDVCDQDICKDMQALVHEQVSQGMSDDAIRAFFVQRYGTRVLLAPEKSAADILPWTVPFIGLLAGALVTFVFVRAGRHHAGTATQPAPAAVPGHYRRLIEEDLRELE